MTHCPCPANMQHRAEVQCRRVPAATSAKTYEGVSQMPNNGAITDAIFDAWERRDFESIVKSMADDVTVAAPGGVVVEGKADVMDWYTSWVTACPDSVAGAVCVGETSDSAVMEGVYAGTNTG